MLNRIIIIKIMRIIMRIVMIDLFINKDHMRKIRDHMRIRNRIKIRGLRGCLLLGFLKKHILTISLTRIMILRVIMKILIIRIFIYIMKMRNNFTMRIKRLLLKKRKILKTTKLMLNSYS